MDAVFPIASGLGVINTVLILVNAVLYIRIGKTKRQKDFEIEADKVTDRLLELQGAELGALQEANTRLRAELAQRDEKISDLEGALADRGRQLSILAEAISHGTKDFRQALVTMLEEGKL